MPGVSPRRRVDQAGVTATAMAPAIASRCACVTSADRDASRTTASRSSAKKAPRGATRIAAPLPKDPSPPKRLRDTDDHGSPVRTRASAWCIAEP